MRASLLLRTLGVVLLPVVALLLLENLGARPLFEVNLYLPGLDKVLHFGQSLAVCLALAWVMRRSGFSLTTQVTVAAGAAFAAAGVDELQQLLRSDRSVELADVGAGAAGITCAIGALAWRLSRRGAVVLLVIGIAAGGAIVFDTYQRLSHYNRGVLAERAGKTNEALAHYLNAVNSGVGHADSYNAAAWLMTETAQGDPARAVAYAERALMMRPGHPDTLDTYGWALLRAGRPADAVTQLETALAANPEIYCIHYHLGMAYLALDRRDDGRRHLRLQLERMPMTREAALAADQLSKLDAEARHQ